MLFAIRLLRYRGRVLSWRELENRPDLTGDLRREQCHDEELWATSALLGPVPPASGPTGHHCDLEAANVLRSVFMLTGGAISQHEFARHVVEYALNPYYLLRDARQGGGSWLWEVDVSFQSRISTMQHRVTACRGTRGRARLHATK